MLTSMVTVAGDLATALTNWAGKVASEIGRIAAQPMADGRTLGDHLQEEVRKLEDPEPADSTSLWGKGCPETVWDGPYSMRCSLGGDAGTCARHGQFASPPEAE